jgi:hypothetical protein
MKKATILKFIILLAIPIMVFIYSFNSYTTPNTYLNYVNDLSGPYISNKKFDKFNFIVQYTPEPYLAIKSLEGMAHQKEFEEALNKYKGTKNFILQLESPGQSDILKSIVPSVQKYNELIEYLSFDIKKDMYLCFKNDTIPCLYSNFERIYNIAPYVRIQFGFKLDSIAIENFKKTDQFAVLFDAASFQHGPLYFGFDGAKVNELPKLKF